MSLGQIKKLLFHEINIFSVQFITYYLTLLIPFVSSNSLRFFFETSHPILYISKLTKNSPWVPPLSNFSSFFTLLLLSFHTIFTQLSSFYTLKISGSHFFTHFSFFFFSLYFLTSVYKPNVKYWLRRREYDLTLLIR